MLAIARVKSSRYYISTAQEQIEFDHTKPGEPPGRWLDTEGASFLGLSQTVNRFDFLSLTQKDALKGKKLFESNNTKKKEALGWDLTFSAPKSVSILWALSNDALRAKIEQAHDTAITKAIEYLEQEALEGDKSLVVAAFQQGTSRDGGNPVPDPLLHTHAVAIPIFYDKSKNSMQPLYRCAGLLYRHKMAAGALYRLELATALQRTIEVALEREKSWFEVAGFSREHGKYQEVMNYFSSRRLRIEAISPGDAIEAQKIAYATREKKEGAIPRRELFSQWQEASREHGLHPKHLYKFLQEPLVRLAGEKKWIEWRTVKKAARAVTRHQSHFTRRDLVRALAEAAQVRGLQKPDILNLTDKYIASRHVISLGQVDKEIRYANRRLYRLEKRLLNQARKLRAKRSFNVAIKHIRAASQEHKLTPEQVKALHEITARGRIKILSGISGTGKTHTLGAARQAWEKNGYTVIGIALSGKQTQQLAEQTGKKPGIISGLLGKKQQNMTISRLLWEMKRARINQLIYGSRSVANSPLTAKTVVIADNAQDIGAAQIECLVKEVRRAGAKLVLSGDIHQPQAYTHSGALGALIKSIGASLLTKIERQKQAVSREIVQDVSRGDASSALETLNQQGLLSISNSKEQALTAIIKEWSHRGIKRPDDHLLITHTNDDAVALNRLAQLKLIDAGVIAPSGIKVGKEFIRKGDRVKFQESAKTYGIFRNNRGTVRHIDPITKVALVRLDTGKTKAINLRDYSGMTLGYAVTTAESKDIEVRHGYLLAQGSGQDTALVQISRATEQTRVYAYSVEEKLEAQLELARKMSWTKMNELAIQKQAHPQSR